MKKIKQNINQIKKVYKLCADLSKSYFPITFIVCILRAATPFITIIGSSMLIDGFMKKLPIENLLLIAFCAVILNVVFELVKDILDKRIDTEEYAIGGKLDMLMSKKVLDMDYEHVENPKVHSLRQSVDMDQMTFGGIYNIFWNTREGLHAVFSIIFSIVTLIGMFSVWQGTIIDGRESYGWINSPLFLLALGFLIVLMVYLTSRITTWSIKAQFSVIDKLVEGNKIFFYFVQMIQQYKSGKDIRIYNAKHVIKKEVDDLFKSDVGMRTFAESEEIQGKSDAARGGVTAIIGTVIYIFVGLKAWIGVFQVGSVIRYAGAINELIAAVRSIVGSAGIVAITAQRCQNIFDFLQLPDVLYHGTLTVEKRIDNDYEIEFHNVSFKYPGCESYALKKLNLKFKVGQRMAVVGQNGSGKTTMIKLLCRLYDPTEGNITLNGIDIKKYDYGEYMSIFSVVFQDFKLFSFSLAQNIAASVDCDEEKANICLDRAGIKERVSKMEKGLNTPLYKDFEDDGVEISGGEAQKIALSRALYKDAPFIVLDEPTAALDPIAESEIYSKFDEIVGEKTAIYISHRLSSCRFCDDIAVFDKGELIERGNHDTLISNEKGKYYSLWNAQAQYYQ